MDVLFDPDVWIAFAMLTSLEVVLGIDNVLFLGILVGRLPPAQRDAARRLGLAAAMGTRILLLLSLGWVMRLTAPLFAVVGHDVTGRDLVLFGGGLFLLWKASTEMFRAVEHDESSPHGPGGATRTGFLAVIAQIGLVDIVFSLDSVVTAVGMVDRIGVMIAAVVAAVGVMMFAARIIGEFVDRHPSVKMLALAFLAMVGMTLTAEAFGVHVPKAVIYAAMGFSLAVELLNLRARARRAQRAAEAAKTVSAHPGA